MKRKNILIAGFVIIIVAAFLIQLFRTPIPYELLSNPQEGELDFSVVPEKTLVNEGELFNISLILTNVGNDDVTVWKLREQTSYDISFFRTDGIEVPYLCGVISRTQLTNDVLVELSPGQSLIRVQDSGCWNLTPGEYLLSATYHTNLGERITKPYWVGREKADAIAVTVE